MPKSRGDYRSKYKKWINWLGDSGVHSVANQLRFAVVDYVFLIILMKAIDLSKRKNKNEEKSRYIVDAIISKFYESLLMSIRRLTECTELRDVRELSKLSLI